jgi:hypothetical protein
MAVDGTVFIPFHFAKAAANKLTNAALDPVSGSPNSRCAPSRSTRPPKKPTRQSEIKRPAPVYREPAFLFSVALPDLHLTFRVKHIHFFQVIAQIDALVGSQDAQGEAQQGPQVDRLPRMVPDFTQVVDLGMAVVAGGDAVLGPGGQDLVGLEFAVVPTLIG